MTFHAVLSSMTFYEILSSVQTWPSYVGRDVRSMVHTHHPSNPPIAPSFLEVISPVLCYHCLLKILVSINHYSKKLADEPWDDGHDDYDS